MSIFVQMVAYNNFDVIPTVKDCIKNAKDKENLYFGICLVQNEEVPPELDHPRIKVSNVSLDQGFGHGFARSQAQSFYDGQDYTLQIESGCRFLENWDEELINTLKSADSKKPIITNYANKLSLEKSEKEYPDVSYKIWPYSFSSSGDLMNWPHPLKNIKNLTKASMVSDHFFFTIGQHCKDCVYDSNLYFSEVESVLSIKSYTAGYDFFHHHKPVVWREYSRPMYWENNNDWWLKDRQSKERFQKMLLGQVEDYKLEGEKSLKDYEHYCGIDFLNRKIQKNTVAGEVPPCKYENDTQWQSEYMKDYSIVASWDPSEIEKCEDYDYWYFTIENEKDEIITRQDLRPQYDADIISFKKNYKKVTFKAKEGIIPSKVCVWPVSKSKGWLKKSKFDLN